MAKTKGKKPARAAKAPRAKVDPAEHRLSGPRSKFRHKVRAPISILLTQKGHEKLATELERTGYSRSDFFEGLLHKFGALLPELKAGELQSMAG